MKEKRIWKPKDFVTITDETGKKKSVSIATFCRMLFIQNIEGKITPEEFDEKLRTAFPKNLNLFDRQETKSHYCHCCFD